MNIMQINTNNNFIQNSPTKKAANPSFGAFYSIKGTASELDKFIDILRKKDNSFKVLELKNMGSQKLLGFLTNRTVMPAIENFFKSPIIAKDIFDPSKLVYFDPITSEKNEIIKFNRQGLEFFGNIATKNNGKLFEQSTSIVMANFPNAINLKDGIQKLMSVCPTIEHDGTNFKFPIYKLRNLFPFSSENLIMQSKGFFKGKIEGLKGYGAWSIALKTDTDQVLKFSHSPNTPNIVKPYDIPVFSRKEIKPTSNIDRKLFCALEQNGKSWAETKITYEDEQKLSNKIAAEGDKYIDDKFEQIAKYNNEPYLVDAGAVPRTLWGESLKNDPINLIFAQPAKLAKIAE